MKMSEERFALDNNGYVLDFEDKEDKYCLTQEEVCDLLNKQHQETLKLKETINTFKLICGDSRKLAKLFKPYIKRMYEW